ncbi:restriction endonuclease-like protein [Rugamonas sp. A1-17]|nr:restriction endonuclease-like protein [Rugamonas sp. A1-17]
MSLLLRAEGANWTLEILGKLPELPAFISPTPPSHIATQGDVALFARPSISATLGPKAQSETEESVVAVAPLQEIPPLFFEAVDYDIHFESKLDAACSITLPAGSELRRKKKGVEHHTINFGNNVGFFDIKVEAPDGLAQLRLEVFARKIDYRTDYIAMREDISGVLRNLAMTANSKTYSLAAPARGHKPTLVEWFALLKTYFDDFIKLTNAISNKPHTGLETRVVRRDVDRARHVSRQTIDRALRRGNSGPALPKLDVSIPRRIDERVSRPTFDTPENRYYKALLTTSYRNMRALSKIKETGDEDAERDSERKFFDRIRPELKEMERRLEAAMKAPFLSTVKEVTLERPTSMVFHKHPIYSRVDKMARLLNGGLSFAGDIVPIGVKDTAVLYEYWCFLKIIDLLRDRFDLVEQKIVKTTRLRTTVTLAKGKAASMEFVHIPTQKKLYVFYNRMFRQLPTIAQKPDNVIQFSTGDKFYIFDAKYRVQFDRTYAKQYGGVGPRTDDINTMHRYRDAIAIANPHNPKEYLKGVVMGAVVLFPFPNETEYRQHKFCKSIEQVEIGGLPFLPGATTLVSEKLAQLLAKEFPEPIQIVSPIGV